MSENSALEENAKNPSRPSRGKVRTIQVNKSKLTNYNANRSSKKPPPLKETTNAIDHSSYNSKATAGKYKVTVVLLTWQRLSSLKGLLNMLSKQTYSNFNIRISNGNLVKFKYVENVANIFDGKLDIEVSHEGNDEFAFRRFSVAKGLAERGSDIILFIDDDVKIPHDYIEQCLRYYEPKTYKSGFAWTIDRGGQNYYKYRTRVHNSQKDADYCGTGLSMIDARIFLDPRLIRQAPKEALKIEDLWLSYFAKKVLKWRLAPIPQQNVILEGGDSVALYKQVIKEKHTLNGPDKNDLLQLLVRKYKWKIKA